ncbi:hypothetical protein AX774_g4127 [Zancudomyces culisetae]|uniref:Protein SPA2 n=1 Tax=Zancudomyces culisetae TaxID=1213189 RepID=A0A1R1PN46_ZANCU|nr:hypothetical protein AX774_g4127 [Zancudomyces culisetae]|eukprot:OMH82388.1 hypothetical protein AX774_g4127 [Zancudomyces culisetae]
MQKYEERQQNSGFGDGDGSGAGALNFQEGNVVDAGQRYDEGDRDRGVGFKANTNSGTSTPIRSLNGRTGVGFAQGGTYNDIERSGNRNVIQSGESVALSKAPSNSNSSVSSEGYSRAMAGLDYRMPELKPSASGSGYSSAGDVGRDFMQMTPQTLRKDMLNNSVENYKKEVDQLKQTLLEYVEKEKEYKKIQEEAERLKIENEGYKKALEENEKLISELKVYGESRDKEIETLKAKNTELAKEITALGAVEKPYDRRIDSVETEMDKANSRLGKMMGERGGNSVPNKRQPADFVVDNKSTNSQVHDKNDVQKSVATRGSLYKQDIEALWYSVDTLVFSVQARRASFQINEDIAKHTEAVEHLINNIKALSKSLPSNSAGTERGRSISTADQLQGMSKELVSRSNLLCECARKYIENKSTGPSVTSLVETAATRLNALASELNKFLDSLGPIDIQQVPTTDGGSSLESEFELLKGNLFGLSDEIIDAILLTLKIIKVNDPSNSTGVAGLKDLPNDTSLSPAPVYRNISSVCRLVSHIISMCKTPFANALSNPRAALLHHPHFDSSEATTILKGLEGSYARLDDLLSDIDDAMDIVDDPDPSQLPPPLPSSSGGPGTNPKPGANPNINASNYNYLEAVKDYKLMDPIVSELVQDSAFRHGLAICMFDVAKYIKSLVKLLE